MKTDRRAMRVFSTDERNYDLLIPLAWMVFSIVSVIFLRYGPSAVRVYDVVTGSKLNQCVFGVLIAVGAAILFRRRRRVYNLLASSGPLIALLIYTLISISWADYKIVSVKRSILLLGSIEMVLIVAAKKDKYRAFFSLLYNFFVIMTFLSAISILFIRDISIAEAAGGAAWQGITAQKNNLGQISMLGGFFWIYLLTSKAYPSNNKFNLIFLILNIIFLVNSKSITSYAAFCVASSLYFLLLIFKQHKKGILLFLIMLIIFLMPLSVLIEEFFLKESIFKTVLSFTKKDITFTGRIYIWDLMVAIISYHPIRGVGFGNFWIGKTEGPSKIMYEHLYYLPYHAHNGYLDIMGELGLIGFFIFFIFLIKTFLINIKLLQSDYYLACFWLPIVITVVLSNFPETSFMRHNSVYWLLFISSYLLLIDLYQKPGVNT